LLKTQGANQHQGYWLLNDSLVLSEHQIKPPFIESFILTLCPYFILLKPILPPTLVFIKH
jgi:hypothetical protein